MRKKIPDNTKLILINSNGDIFEYVITKLLSDEGASCLCYIALKIIGEFDSKLVILKEFYPDNSLIYDNDIIRDENGYLHLNYSNAFLTEKYKEFIDGINSIRSYAKNDYLNEFICADKDVEPLYSRVENGSVYCENLYYPNSKQWIMNRYDNTKLSEILITMLGVMRFLKIFHREVQMGYVDVKPQDILITSDFLGNYKLETPIFFDFDATRMLNQYYEKHSIKCTSGFCPSYFEKYDNDKILINIASENCTLVNVLEYMISNKVDKEMLKELILNNKIKNNTEKENMSEVDIYKTIENFKNKLEDEECIQMGKKYYIEKKKYSSVRIVICVVLVILYICFSCLIINLSLGKTQGEEEFILLMILGVIILIFICKLTNYRLASKISNLQVSCKYYDKRDSCGKNLRDKNYNTFRNGKTRKCTTFQDCSENNLNQQKLRWVLWSVLAIGIGTAVAISVIYQALPLMFTIGLVVCVAVMWIDYKPSSIRDFIRYSKKLYSWDKKRFERTFDIEVGKLNNGKIARGIFYYREYCHVPSLDINDNFYKEKRRNLFTLKTDICREGYNLEETKRIPNKLNYDKRLDMIESSRIRNIDLGFENLKIKQIYKMAFDRMKNAQLLLNIVSVVIMLVAIVLSCANCFDGIEEYIRIPSSISLDSAIVLSIGISIFGIIQVLYAMPEEKLIAEMSYKSNFVNQNSLNEILTNDIVAGYIRDVDIARGTSQYEGYVFSRIAGEKEHARNERLRKFLANDNAHNMPLWHYREISNRRRLAVTIWCLFGAILSFFVWYLGYFYLILPLLVLAILTHLIIRNKVMPKFGKSSVFKEINKIVNIKENYYEKLQK